MFLLNAIFGKPIYKKRVVSFGKNKFSVEVADSFRKIMVGLMDHKSLPKNGGMLFIFSQPGRYGFWMLKMKFAIDIIWLNDGGEVVYMWKNAKPSGSLLESRTVTPDRNAKYVLEFAAGTVSKFGIGMGSKFLL